MPMVIPSVSLPAILSGFSIPEFHIFGCGSLHREISFQLLNNIARIVYRAKPMLVSAVLDRVPLRPGIGENNMMVRPIVWQTGDASVAGVHSRRLLSRQRDSECGDSTSVKRMVENRGEDRFTFS